MESTGKYYVPVYNALEGHISNVVVASPKWVRCIKGEKDNNKDAKWIADLFKLGIVRSSFIPDKDIRILRELTRYLYKLTNMRTSEKNRFTNALTVGNCKLDMVFSDIFGKTSSAIINTILSQNEYNDDDILKNVQKNCKSSNEDILNSISGISWGNAQKQRMNVIELNKPPFRISYKIFFLQKNGYNTFLEIYYFCFNLKYPSSTQLL